MALYKALPFLNWDISLVDHVVENVTLIMPPRL